MVEESKWEPDAAWQDTSEPPSSVDEPELPSSEPEPSSQDERALDEINEAVGDARDERAGNILGLRAGKKRLARRVAELLRELREA